MTDLAAPPRANACPRCEEPVEPKRQAQVCMACGTPILLVAGGGADASVTPVAEPKAKAIVAKTSGWFFPKASSVLADGIAHGNRDPVTGQIPVDEQRVPYAELESLGAFRRVDVLLLLLNTILIAPIAALTLISTVREPAMAFFSLPFLLLTLWGYYAAVGIKANWMRVVGGGRVLKFRFDRPRRRRRRFLSEALRRAGIDPTGLENP